MGESALLSHLAVQLREHISGANLVCQALCHSQGRAIGIGTATMGCNRPRKSSGLSETVACLGRTQRWLSSGRLGWAEVVLKQEEWQKADNRELEKQHRICRPGGMWSGKEGGDATRGWGLEVEGARESRRGLCSLPSSLDGCGGGAAQQASPSCVFLRVLGFCVLKLLKGLERLYFEMQDDFHRTNDQIPPNLLFPAEEVVFYHCSIVSAPQLKPSECLPG